jgi:hypothetical protein
MGTYLDKADVEDVDQDDEGQAESYPVHLTLEELEALVFADENQEYDVLQYVQAMNKILVACLAATRNEYATTDDIAE